MYVVPQQQADPIQTRPPAYADHMVSLRSTQYTQLGLRLFLLHTCQEAIACILPQLSAAVFDEANAHAAVDSLQRRYAPQRSADSYISV
jgi:hypothetical protein